MANNLSKALLLGMTMALSGAALSAEEVMMDANQFKMITPKDIQWSDGPASLPKGAKITILEGDMSKDGPFTVRVKLPANYVILPHWHPGIEQVTVLSGDLYLGMGDKLDKNNAKKLPAGSFAYMQPKMHHFAFTKGEVVIQLHGMGPWAINYLNPEDDPRNQKTKDTM